jgi:hypothetical protein
MDSKDIENEYNRQQIILSQTGMARSFDILTVSVPRQLMKEKSQLDVELKNLSGG